MRGVRLHASNCWYINIGHISRHFLMCCGNDAPLAHMPKVCILPLVQLN